ncbi:MAG: KpsF/GutQ family sugar-phosphate isomerase [Rhodospirillales bacterium]|nr:KpsF/GutQ family sugar-phosphate isomerase [Rhodospirillales bacterium]MBO6787854.1 KpsF/GutQ family sugar-phosphate isomerase [Rhodospirillales bacterium]
MNGIPAEKLDDAAARRDIEAARRVIETEIEGLKTLADDIGADVATAIDILASVTGRVVVTGMGKSGHVARKIASTLASTGTPALFVHPAEASHGDLGMITHTDAVFALSNSGETTELADLVDYCKRFEIPLISMTGRADSTLASAADASLVIPAADEACPMGLAPTTSTTVMLALGDAIAVALLARKGFSSEDFHTLHPGGKLGRRLLKVRDIMHGGDELPLIPKDTVMSEALIEMTAKGFGCVGVLGSDGNLAGILTDGDLRRHMSDDLTMKPVAEVMTTGAKTIEPELLASESLHFMNENKITNVFVVKNGKPVGVLHIHDCLRAGVA